MNEQETIAVTNDAEQRDGSKLGVERIVMPPSRYRDLMENDLVRLTDDEYRAGWHFCFEWDGLLVGPGMSEMKCCSCPHRVKPAA